MIYLLRFGITLLGAGCLGGVAWAYASTIGWLYTTISEGGLVTWRHIAAIIAAIIGIIPAYFVTVVGALSLVAGLLSEVVSISVSYNKHED